LIGQNKSMMNDSSRGLQTPLPARDERGPPLRLSSRGGDLAPLRQRTAWHESGHVVVSRAMDFPISCVTVEPNKWFSGRCLAPLSPPDDSPKQQIAAAQAICDQARAIIGNTLGQDPMEFAEWRTHVHARCTILAAGNCAEQIAFPDIAPLDNGMDRTLSRIYAESICAPSAIEAFLEYARQEATALLVSQRHVLEALAEALEVHGSLSGPEKTPSSPRPSRPVF
jgi:hypothetical protein